MRLIDADAVIAFIDRGHLNNQKEKSWSDEEVESIIESRPTIDAVSVVRCKDCRYFEYMSTCIRNGIRISRVPNDYCSRGKKREVKNE